MTRIAVTTEAVRLKAKADKLTVAKARADERQRINDKKIEDRKAERAPKLAAVDVIGKQIASLADKIKRESDTEAAARQKGDSFFKQLTDKLAEVEPLAKAAKMTMKELKLKYVGDRLGDTRFKLAIRIARGLITHEQVNEEERTKKQTQRAAAKPAAPAPMSGMTAARLAKSAAEGNGEDRQRLLDAGYRESIGGDGKPTFAEPDAEPVQAAPVVADAPPTQPEPVLGEYQDTPAKKSKRAYVACVSALDDNLPEMLDEDKLALFRVFQTHEQMRGVKSRKAA